MAKLTPTESTGRRASSSAGRMRTCTSATRCNSVPPSSKGSAATRLRRGRHLSDSRNTARADEFVLHSTGGFRACRMISQVLAAELERQTRSTSVRWSFVCAVRQEEVHPIRRSSDYIPCWPWGEYLGHGALENGVDAGVSSWHRVAPNTIPAAAKMAAQLPQWPAGQDGSARQRISTRASRWGRAGC